jgi:hypothetical protein
MIAALRLGMPRPAAQMHSLVLLHMKYFIKTAHGISDSFYHVVQDYLLYGTGQGSGASPLVWLSLVVILLTALMVLAPLAMSFVDPWEDIHEERNADSFVDDTSNGCNDAHLDEPAICGTDCHGPSWRSNLLGNDSYTARAVLLN